MEISPGQESNPLLMHSFDRLGFAADSLTRKHTFLVWASCAPPSASLSVQVHQPPMLPGRLRPVGTLSHRQAPGLQFLTGVSLTGQRSPRFAHSIRVGLACLNGYGCQATVSAFRCFHEGVAQFPGYGVRRACLPSRAGFCPRSMTAPPRETLCVQTSVPYRRALSQPYNTMRKTGRQLYFERVPHDRW